jgi:hypothetical protein
MVDIDSFLHNANKFEKAVDFLRFESMEPDHDQHYEKELRRQVEEDRGNCGQSYWFLFLRVYYDH